MVFFLLLHCICCNWWPGRAKWNPTGVVDSPRPKKGLTDLLCWSILSWKYLQVLPIYTASLEHFINFELPSFWLTALSSTWSCNVSSRGHSLAFLPGFLVNVPKPFKHVKEKIVFSVNQLSSSLIGKDYFVKLHVWVVVFFCVGAGFTLCDVALIESNLFSQILAYFCFGSWDLIKMCLTFFGLV